MVNLMFTLPYVVLANAKQTDYSFWFLSLPQIMAEFLSDR